MGFTLEPCGESRKTAIEDDLQYKGSTDEEELPYYRVIAVDAMTSLKRSQSMTDAMTSLKRSQSTQSMTDNKEGPKNNETLRTGDVILSVALPEGFKDTDAVSAQQYMTHGEAHEWYGCKVSANSEGKFGHPTYKVDLPVPGKHVPNDMRLIELGVLEDILGPSDNNGPRTAPRKPYGKIKADSFRVTVLRRNCTDSDELRELQDRLKGSTKLLEHTVGR